FFPPCLWKWSRRYLAEFLRVLMSCDGSIYQVDGKPRIDFTVAAPQLAADLHHVLIRFGFVAKYYQKSANVWRVEMTDPESVMRYQEQIGWIGEKSTRFIDLERSVPRRLGNNGHPPRETWELVRSAIQERELSFIELARRSGETTKIGKFAGY